METNNDDKILTHKNQEESLEISSTGYGLESVRIESKEEPAKQQTKGTNPSCGGL